MRSAAGCYVDGVPLRGIISFLSGNDLVSNKDSAIVLHSFAISNLIGNIAIFCLWVFTLLYLTRIKGYGKILC